MDSLAYTGAIPSSPINSSLGDAIPMGPDIGSMTDSFYNNQIDFGPGSSYEANHVKDLIGKFGDQGTQISSPAEYMAKHPGASPEDVMRYMASISDEWAEKYIDYLTEQGAIDKANQYNASREDTAYQRLVADMKAAGLNPALLYGGSASPVGSSASGFVKMSEGSQSRQVSSYSKLSQLLLNYMTYEYKKKLETTNTAFNSLSKFGDFLAKLLKWFI